MKALYKNILSVIMSAVLIFNMTEICYSQENQSVIKNNPTESLCSGNEIEEYVENVDGITVSQIDDENITVEDAVEEVFCSEDILEADITGSEITEYKDTKYITEIYEEQDLTYVKTYSEDMMQMSIVSYDGVNINSDSYVFNSETGEYEKGN